MYSSRSKEMASSSRRTVCSCASMLAIWLLASSALRDTSLCSSSSVLFSRDSSSTTLRSESISSFVKEFWRTGAGRCIVLGLSRSGAGEKPFTVEPGDRKGILELPGAMQLPGRRSVATELMDRH